MVGEQALEPPSYYFTKPAVTPADPTASTCQPPPDGAQRFSRRVRGIASETLKTDTAEPSSAQPPYRMITKRIRFRRATLPRSVSPWCRSSRRRYRKVIVYVDENGKELSALDMHKRAKAGIPQSAVETEKKIENAASDNSTKKASRILSTPSSETRSKRSSVSICTSAASEPSSVAVAASGQDGRTAMDVSVSRSVVINAASCTGLLSNTVSRTSGYSVDRLLRLHHQMSLMIYQHRHSYDKTALLQDLEQCLH